MTVIPIAVPALPRKTTRTVRIDLLYTYPGSRPGTEWVEAWTKPIDGLHPNQIVAYTADPTVQDTLKIAHEANRPVTIDVDDTDHGLRIIGIEEVAA